MLKWKTLNGRPAYDLEAPGVDKMASPARLTVGELFPQTTGFMIAMQDQGISTNNYYKYSLRDPNIATDICRKYGEQSETIQHITDACRARTPIVTIQQPTLSIKNWLSNVNCQREHHCRIVNMCHIPC